MIRGSSSLTHPRCWPTPSAEAPSAPRWDWKTRRRFFNATKQFGGRSGGMCKEPGPLPLSGKYATAPLKILDCSLADSETLLHHPPMMQRPDTPPEALFQGDHRRRHLVLEKRIATIGVNRLHPRRHNRVTRH